MRGHILITGPSGAGKTHLARFFREHGKNAFDADEVPRLAGWVDLTGNAKEVNVEEWRAQAGIRWWWSAERMAEFLQQNEGAYLFGGSANLYQFLSSFDRRYYLQASTARVSQRLADPNRDNDFGRTAVQRKWGSSGIVGGARVER